MASRLIGAIVGTFKVGDGTKVGQPTFQPDKPKLILKGGPFHINLISGDFKVVTVGKGVLNLKGKGYAATSTFNLPITHAPVLILKGKPYEAKEPYKMVVGQPKLRLKAKGYTINKSASIVIGKPKLILKGGQIKKAGKAGLVPLVPTEVQGTPTVPRPGLLVPTAAYPSELLVPTAVKVI